MVRVDFEKKEILTKVIVDREMFFDLLDAVENCLEDLSNVNVLLAARTIKEMRFCASFDYQFRQDTYPELEEFYYDLYERIHA